MLPPAVLMLATPSASASTAAWGRGLAELQVATLFDVLLDRGLMPVQTGKPDRVNNCFVHGYRKLPVRLEQI